MSKTLEFKDLCNTQFHKASRLLVVMQDWRDGRIDDDHYFESVKEKDCDIDPKSILYFKYYAEHPFHFEQLINDIVDDLYTDRDVLDDALPTFNVADIVNGEENKDFDPASELLNRPAEGFSLSKDVRCNLGMYYPEYLEKDDVPFKMVIKSKEDGAKKDFFEPIKNAFTAIDTTINNTVYNLTDIDGINESVRKTLGEKADEKVNITLPNPDLMIGDPFAELKEIIKNKDFSLINNLAGDEKKEETKKPEEKQEDVKEATVTEITKVKSKKDRKKERAERRRQKQQQKKVNVAEGGNPINTNFEMPEEMVQKRAEILSIIENYVPSGTKINSIYDTVTGLFNYSVDFPDGRRTVFTIDPKITFQDHYAIVIYQKDVFGEDIACPIPLEEPVAKNFINIPMYMMTPAEAKTINEKYYLPNLSLYKFFDFSNFVGMDKMSVESKIKFSDILTNIVNHINMSQGAPRMRFASFDDIFNFTLISDELVKFPSGGASSKNITGQTLQIKDGFLYHGDDKK